MSWLRRPILTLAHSARVKELVESMPVTSGIVRRYVAGETTADAVRAAAELARDGRYATIDHLGEDTLDEAQAAATVDAYLDLLAAIHDADLAGQAEVSIKLTAIGLALDDGEKVALEHARRICRAAANIGTTVTLDMEDHATTDATLHVLRELRKDFPDTGAVLQAYLRRTESDCRRLATEGSRVRLCKGAYDEGDDVAFTDPLDVDRSYVRCMRVLLAGAGYPMLATHDPRLIEIARFLADEARREPGTYEFQMLYGIRTAEQRRLASLGEKVRVYVPYGQEWYGYLMRRLAERPRNLTFFLRSLVSQR